MKTTEEKEKRYCKNCKHFRIGFFNDECWLKAPYYETDKSNKEYPDIIYQDYLHKLEKDTELNKNNNCDYYKKKNWWKFWIK